MVVRRRARAARAAPRPGLVPVGAVPSRCAALPSLAAALIATNWLVYIWAVNTDHVIEAALGYYINPLVTVALGVGLLGERLRRMQVVALAFGAAAVGVLTVAYGRVPWIALVLACSFGGYSFLKKAVPVGAVTSLAVETMVLLPVAATGLVALALAARPRSCTAAQAATCCWSASASSPPCPCCCSGPRPGGSR